MKGIAFTAKPFSSTKSLELRLGSFKYLCPTDEPSVAIAKCLVSTLASVHILHNLRRIGFENIEIHDRLLSRTPFASLVLCEDEDVCTMRSIDIMYQICYSF